MHICMAFQAVVVEGRHSGNSIFKKVAARLAVLDGEWSEAQ
jgi:hypothetical protein